MSSQFYGNSIFWIEIEKISPNPYQPRREFDEARLKDLADSIRQYGVLQPLVVTRREFEKPDGGLGVEYELIAGERRLRASKLAGLSQVPALIRASADDARTKLELAIIENLQREDLNAMDRAHAFERLAKEFNFKHTDIAAKIGKSREYVSNTMRLLMLSPEIQQALVDGKISEGHTRPLLMLANHEAEQVTLFKEIVYKRLTVREAEAIARRVATERVRNKSTAVDPEIIAIERELTNTLGTRVKIERKEQGGKIVIDYFSQDDLQTILHLISTAEKNPANLMDRFIESTKNALGMGGSVEGATLAETAAEVLASPASSMSMDDKPTAETRKEEEDDTDIYSLKDFSI